MKKVLLSLALFSNLLAADISNIDKICKSKDQTACSTELGNYCKEDLKACYEYSKDLCAKDSFGGCLFTTIAGIGLIKMQAIDVKEAYVDTQNAISKLCELPAVMAQGLSSHAKFCVLAGDGMFLQDAKNYGLERNPQKALNYYKKACDANSSIGCKKYEDLKKLLK